MQELDLEPEARRSGRHPSPPLALLAGVFAGLFVASLATVALATGGGHFPSPFVPGAQSFFARHGQVLAWSALLQFGAAIPLGLFSAVVVSRLQFFGLKVAGTQIALFGGFAASFFLALSALLQWVLLQPGAGDDATTGALHLAAFATGGPGHVVPLGLLIAGVSIAGGLSRLLPKWLMAFGVAIALLAELSCLGLIFPGALYLLPLARFPALIWLILVGALLPASRAGARRKGAPASRTPAAGLQAATP
jgi:hypothetical protein